MRLTNNSGDIPQYLKNIPRWIIWELTANGQKIPKRPQTSGLVNGSSTDPSCWSDFNTAARAMLHHCEARDVGLGFVLADEDSPCPIVGFDLDNSLSPDGQIKPWAVTILESLANIAYTEVSPSGTGLKSFVAGELPEGFLSKKSFGDGKEGTEVYGSGRYFAVTGDALGEDSLASDLTSPASILAAVESCVDKRAAKRPEYVRIDHRASIAGDRVSSYLNNCGGVGDGGRNNKIYNIAGHLAVNFKLGDSDVLKHVSNYNAMNCSPPLSQHELEQTVRSALKTCHDRLDDTTNEEEYAVRFEEEFSETLYDLDSMLKNADKKRKISVDQSDLNAPGLIRDIMNNYKHTAKNWLPELAFVTSLNILATAMAGKVKIKGNGAVPCIFSVGLAPSGCGKEFGRKLTNSILNKAGLGDRLGPEGISSAEGFIKPLERNPCLLYQIDEAGELFTQMSNPNSHMSKLGSAMKIAYSKAGDEAWRPNSRSDRQNNIEINNPHPVIYCTTTHSRFWSGFDSNSVEDGLLGRMLVFEQEGYDMRFGRPYLAPDPSDSIIHQVAAWSGNGNLPDSVATAKAMEWPLSKEAQDVFTEFDNKVILKRVAGDMAATLFSRTADKIHILALLFAGSRLGPVFDGEISGNDMRRAIGLVKRMTYRMISRVENLMSSNDTEKSVKYIVSQIDKQPGRKIEKGKISQITKKIKKHERSNIISDLLDAGTLEMTENKAGTQFYRLI